MNFPEIKNKYPKALNLVEVYFCEDYKLNGDFNDRDLYDFFDKQGIIIEIIKSKKDTYNYNPMFNYNITVFNKFKDKHSYKTYQYKIL